MHKRFIRTSFGAVCAALLVLPSVSPALAAPSDADVARARDIQNQTQMSLSAIETRLEELSAESDRLDAAALHSRAEADKAQKAAYQAVEDLSDAQERAADAKKDTDAARANMAALAQALYQDGASNMTSAYYFFDADSLQAANDRQRAFTQLGSAADQRAREFQNLNTVAQTLQKRADAKAAQLNEMAEKAKEAEAAARKASENAAAQVQEADRQRQNLLVQLAQAKNTTIELEAQRLAQIEEDRQARSAARAAQHEAEKDRQAQAAAAAAQQSSSAQSSAPSSSSGGQAKRDQIASYAQTFEGVPYVWAGTSPVHGWDCSGFVQYVYRQFGIYLPRGGDAQGRSGRVISADEAQAGDLVWWPGQHVAIYLGNGRTFAARTEETGTGYSSLYGYYLFVRLVD